MRAWAALAVVILGSGAIPAQVLPAVNAPALGARPPALGARPPALGARPPAVEQAGWRPVFATDFSGTDRPPESEPYDGPQGGVAASYYRPDEVAVADGMLQLTMRRRDFGGRPYTTGGVGCDEVVQAYGRYEFRAKVRRPAWASTRTSRSGRPTRATTGTRRSWRSWPGRATRRRT